MSLSRKWLIALMIFCLLITAASLGSLALPAQAQETAPQPICVLRDDGGRLALWDRSGRLLQRYEIYTRLLPAQDAEQLVRGVDIYSRAQLERLLEDYGG